VMPLAMKERTHRLSPRSTYLRDGTFGGRILPGLRPATKELPETLLIPEICRISAILPLINLDLWYCRWFVSISRTTDLQSLRLIPICILPYPLFRVIESDASDWTLTVERRLLISSTAAVSAFMSFMAPFLSLPEGFTLWDQYIFWSSDVLLHYAEDCGGWRSASINGLGFA
jgi:hypothetical protein